MRNFKWLALVVLLSSASSTRSVQAHGECEYCSLEVLGDSEVELKNAGKTVDYRCVYCALAQAKKFKGNLFIKAPLETKGKWVTISRTSGKWSSSVPNVLFVAKKASHVHCQTTYRAISSRKAYDAYLKKNKALVGGTVSRTLTQMLAFSKAI